jgi:cardiolipin synthase
MRRGVGIGYRRAVKARSMWVTVLVTCTASAAVAVAASTPRAALGSAGHSDGMVYYRLVQYPGAGYGGFYGQVAHAQRTLDMEIYELADPTAERDLGAAAARGVRVRVLLDQDFSGGEVNRSAFGYLAAHGVEVRWAPPGYIFHIKTTSFDGTTSDISTANLVSKYYRSTRDAEIVDSDPVHVHAIEATFGNDWTAGASGSPRSQTVQAPGLVWSPNTGSGTAEVVLVRQIGSARNSVDFESEELSDPAIYRALAADARRGVSCRVVMTRSSEWNSAFRAITSAGCHVRLFSDSSTALYIHEKLILADGNTANASLLLGSQNASVGSLTRNRELGILLKRAHGAGSAIAAAGATFDSDFARASPWSVPTPAPTPTPSSCHPRSSSGSCYEPGERCSDPDHGTRGVAGDGEAIVCRDNNGWRWEPA